jgi:hypothetical protein
MSLRVSVRGPTGPAAPPTGLEHRDDATVQSLTGSLALPCLPRWGRCDQVPT